MFLLTFDLTETSKTKQAINQITMRFSTAESDYGKTICGARYKSIREALGMS